MLMSFSDNISSIGFAVTTVVVIVSTVEKTNSVSSVFVLFSEIEIDFEFSTDVVVVVLSLQLDKLNIANNENIKVVSERLGHTNITETLNTYTHVMDDMKNSTGELLSTIFDF